MEPDRSLIDMTDEAIVALSRSDRNVFGVLVERYEAKMIRYVRRLGIYNVDDQMDILQEIFIKVYKNLNAFDTSLSFSSWLYRIAHNETVSWYRKENIRPTGHLIAEGDEVLAFLKSPEVSAEMEFMISQSAATITTALDKLEARYRDPIVLRYFEHKEYDEISDILEIPPGTVGTLIHRGKRRLRELIPLESVELLDVSKETTP